MRGNQLIYELGTVLDQIVMGMNVEKERENALPVLNQSPMPLDLHVFSS